jgi:hypothetical protein
MPEGTEIPFAGQGVPKLRLLPDGNESEGA